jgi:hypothetical protein
MSSTKSGARAGTGTRDRRERGDDLHHLEIENGGVNISDTWRSPISSFRCAAALVAYCPFSFCASSSACLKSFLIECHVRLTVEPGVLPSSCCLQSLMLSDWLPERWPTRASAINSPSQCVGEHSPRFQSDPSPNDLDCQRVKLDVDPAALQNQ